MAAKMVKTSTPGVFKRGTRYVFTYRDQAGAQRWGSARTLEEARRAKAATQTDVARGEFEQRSRVTLHEYLREWVERYQGTGRRGYREETRDEDRRLLERHALRYFSPKLKLTEVTPSTIAGFVAWLCDGREQGKNAHRISVEEARAAGRREPEPLADDATRPLGDSTVRNALKPLRTALATARREGLIRSNPATDVALPHRDEINEDEDQPRPFPSGTMELVVQLVHPRHRLLFELLASTGLRRSEVIALEGRHLALDGDRPHVKVRQRARRQRGNGIIVGPLKSRYARRDVPIPLELADRLRALGTAQDEFVFRSIVGTIVDPDNLAERVLSPACAEAGVEWAGFHTFRHTVASRLFAEGRNAVQVQRWLGHHSPAFTLATYVHLLDDDLGEPLAPQSANKVRTDPTPLHATRESAMIGETSD